MQRKKRILIIGQHFWPESFRINDIADYFIEQDCEVDVLCGIPNYPKGKFFEGYSYFKNKKQQHNGINIRRTFEIPRGNNTNIRIFLNYISYPIASVFHLPRLMTKKYDKIFIYQLSPVMMSITGILLGKLKRTETTMYVLDLWPENLYSVLPINNRFLRLIAEKVSHWHYKRVNKLITLSEKMNTRLASITGISEENITIIPQTCEKVYEAELHDSKLSKRFNKGFNILFAGNISPAQSFETIIDAAQLLKKDGITDINWIIVGDGMSKQDIVDKVKKAGLSEYFYFEGYQQMQDIPKYTVVADALIGCLVKSDLLEATIPAKVISYLAAGKPLVLAMDGEVQKLINDTIKCGYAGPTGDSQKLAGNIKALYKLSPKQRSKLGEQGRAYYFKNFERSIVLERMYSFIFK